MLPSDGWGTAKQVEMWWARFFIEDMKKSLHLDSHGSALED